MPMFLLFIMQSYVVGGFKIIDLKYAEYQAYATQYTRTSSIFQ